MNSTRHSPGLLACTLCRAALTLPLILVVAATHATSISDVVTSSGGSWGGAGNNSWTPTAVGSVVSAAEVQGKLAAASQVKVLTHTADPLLAVKAALTLAATSHLELISHRDIAIQAPVQAAGASITMRYGQGSVAAGNIANLAVLAPVHLSAGSTYTARLGNDGVDISHTIITSLGAAGSTTGADLQGMNGDVGKHYVLGADIDASATSAWNSNAGFDPVGKSPTPFTGTFDGLGHVIAGLTINRPGEAQAGLFGSSTGARLRNVGLENVEIRASSSVGALSGYCDANCEISGSFAAGNVTALAGSAGGLVGMSFGTIRNSYATGTVAGANAGGLLGSCLNNTCSVTGSYASGSVTATGAGGGLVGWRPNSGVINTSHYATTDAGGGPINNAGATGGAWSGNSYGTAAALVQLQTLSTFTTAGWDIDDAGGTGKLWRIYDGHTTPLLRSFFSAPLTITATSGTKPFDGTTASLGVTYTPPAPDARLLGTPVAAAASSAVGAHAVNVTGAYFAQRGYDITLVSGALTITAIVVPSAPIAPAATPGNAQAIVSWSPPASDGGGPITRYTVTGTPAGTCTVTTGSPLPTTCTVPGLNNGTPYTFRVKATNALGDSVFSAPSSAVTPIAPVVVAPPAEDPGPSATPIDSSGTTTITNPSLPVVVRPGAGGGTIVLPGSGTTPVTLQVTINGQPLTVQALPGTQLRIAEVNSQSVLVLVVLEGWASMTSSAVGQPMVLAGPVLLSAGSAGTTVEAQPLAVAVQVGSLTAPTGSLPAVGSIGLQAGERLQVNDQGAVVAITLGSLKGDAQQPGDPMAFANLPASITVDSKAFARLNGALARLSGGNLAQGLEVASSGVFMVRDGGQVFQLLPTQPITIDARLPDGMGFTPLGLLRWVRGGVVVQFAPAVADLAGLAGAVTAALPDATVKLGAEGVLQLRTGGQTYVLRPDWTGGGTATGTPQIGVDEQGRMYLQTGQGTRQFLVPALLNATQVNSIVTMALPSASLASQPGSVDGSWTLTLAGQSWRLVPQSVLPTEKAAQMPPDARKWWIGPDGLLYLKIGTQVQSMTIQD